MYALNWVAGPLKVGPDLIQCCSQTQPGGAQNPKGPLFLVQMSRNTDGNSGQDI